MKSKGTVCQKRLSERLHIKRDMLMVYKHTGKGKDYEVYEDTLNAATNEVRKSKAPVTPTRRTARALRK